MITSFFQKITNIVFPPTCYLCQKDGDVLCATCLTSLHLPLDTPHAWITSLYSFKDQRVKKIVHAIKFFHRKDLCVPLGRELTKLLPPHDTSWVLVPVPAHLFRKLGRGYNQAEVLARALHTTSSLPLDTTLIKRTKQSVRQVETRSRKERLSNQKNTCISTKKVTGQRIILIDDVTTTGATLKEARTVLMDAGALEVIALTIAH